MDGTRVTAPRINRVYHIVSGAHARGAAYRRDHSIQVMVEFDRAVEVTGVPKIAVIIGTKARWARFLASLDSETGLYFCYTVHPDDRDTDGISIRADSLSLNGGAITLAGDAETAAVLTHAAVDGYWRVDGGVTAVEAVLQTVAKSLKQVTDGILDLIAPYRTTYSYPSETPCPEAS